MNNLSTGAKPRLKNRRESGNTYIFGRNGCSCGQAKARPPPIRAKIPNTSASFCGSDDPDCSGDGDGAGSGCGAGAGSGVSSSFTPLPEFLAVAPVLRFDPSANVVTTEKLAFA